MNSHVLLVDKLQPRLEMDSAMNLKYGNWTYESEIWELERKSKNENKSPPAVPSAKTKPRKDFDPDQKVKRVNETVEQKNKNYYEVEKEKRKGTKILAGIKNKPPVPPRTTVSLKARFEEISLIERKTQSKGNRRRDFPPVPDKNSKPTPTFVTLLLW